MNSQSAIPDFFAPHSDDLQLAAKAAFAAGEIVREGYSQSISQSSIDAKAVGDLVSQIDIDADQAATEILQTTNLPILSEELNPEVDQKDSEMWIVDPLDGTTAYLMKAAPRFSSVLIAKSVNGDPVLGITYFPLTGEWFYATRGQGAFKNGMPLQLPKKTWELRHAWVEMNQYGNAKFETPFFASLRTALRSPEGAQIVTCSFPNAGVAMRILEQDTGLCAAVHDNGDAHLKQGPWDIAANQVIFEEAGGVFLNPQGKPTSPFVAEPIIVAPTKKLGLEIIELASCSAI